MKHLALIAALSLGLAGCEDPKPKPKPAPKPQAQVARYYPVTMVGKDPDAALAAEMRKVFARCLELKRALALRGVKVTDTITWPNKDSRTTWDGLVACASVDDPDVKHELKLTKISQL